MSKKLNRKNIAIALISIILIAFIWFLLTADFSLFHRSKPGHYDSFMTNVHAIKLNQFGKPHDELFTPNIKHYLKNDSAIAIKPIFIFYGKKGPPWHIQGDQAHSINGNKVVFLTGHVRITQPPGLNSRNVTLTTTEMTLYPKRSFAETDQPVTIRQPGSIVHGVGMTADLNKGDVKILSQTHGMYGDVSNNKE